MPFLVQIGFFTITFWDLLDILIVGYLLFQVYKLLKGSLGFSIFLGLVFVYFAWWLVDFLQMPLLSSILGQFISVGMIALLILFQPEVRRFLLLLGQGSLQARFKMIERFLRQGSGGSDSSEEKKKVAFAIGKALQKMSKTKTGALMIFTPNTNIMGMYSSGVNMNADISTQLILSIFQKESPLHDGAMIIKDNKIVVASCVLPVSENPNIPQKLGLRHRAAIGITEKTSVVSFIVSEETGNVSYARNGHVILDLGQEKLLELLERAL
jgi:uncharacterized protein (TIGR00159 family)